MQTIIVMVPIEVEVSIHPSGKVRVHKTNMPHLVQIEDLMGAVPRAELKPWHNIIDKTEGQDINFAIVQK